MVKHMILWKLNEELSPAEKETVKKNAKQALEALAGQVDGLVDIHVQIEGLASSNCDMMLDSTLRDEAALQGYQSHPLHQNAANTYVRPYTAQRLCLDFEQ